MNTLKIDMDTLKKNLLNNKERADFENKNPLKKYSRCKNLINEMNVSNDAYSKMIKILIDELGI